ncbi:esterase-like activity of phytase family protein [Streptomyces sp. NPDC004609]|uniref:esterase-like activity of phytase family protein n=1 Tax=Streptomyces sp. NPDC004609 TaxID=3364704 RepID=UPI0036AB0FB9
MPTHWHRAAQIAAVALSVLAVGLSAAPAPAHDRSSERIHEVDPSGGPGDRIGLDGGCADGTAAPGITTAAAEGVALACTAGSGKVLPNEVWPGGASVTEADTANLFGGNLSGLSFESTDVLWAVNNGPAKLYRLVPDGPLWSPDKGGWSSGKALRYATGSAEPDAEGVVVTPDGLFVSTEGDNGQLGTGTPKILRFDASSTASSLTATGEWNVSSDLPSVPANKGLEGIVWIPDTFLTSQGFRDERTAALYDPASYPGHGTGLFFTGLETSGTIYAYALDLSGGGFTRVASFDSGLLSVMAMEWEPATGRLWAACDNHCQGGMTTLGINAQGQFAATHAYDRPIGLPDYNHEGFAIAPQAACIGGQKPVIWADDKNNGGHALRAGTLDCTGPVTSGAGSGAGAR